MKIYELIKRLEHIRDKMESTFSNEFQRGEIDNLIEELIQMTPEVGKTIQVPEVGKTVQVPFFTYPISNQRIATTIQVPEVGKTVQVPFSTYPISNQRIATSTGSTTIMKYR